MGQQTSDIKAREKYERFENEAIPKLVTTLAIPSIISMLITSFYNLADTFFVSFLGTSATGAVGIIMPMMAIIQALGMTFGMGAGSLISRLLGQRNKQRADETLATAFFSIVGIGLVMAVFGFIFMPVVVRFLGATDTIYSYALSYGQIIIINAAIIMSSFVLNNCLRAEGSSFLAMCGIGVGVIINLALDPLFIFTFKMGIAGAALATVISQCISFGVLVSHYFFKRTMVTLHIKNFRMDLKLYWDIFKIGFPSLLRQGFAALGAVILNQVAAPFGDAVIAAMSIFSRITMFVYSATLGLGQGYQPVAGYSYGAKRYERLKEAYWFTVKISFGFSLVIAVVLFVFATGIMGLFQTGDAEVIRLGALALRFQAVVLCGGAIVITTNMSYQSIGNALPAGILALLKQGICYIPALLILPRFFGEEGIAACQAVADLVSLLVAAGFSAAFLRQINLKMKQKMEDEEHGTGCDIREDIGTPPQEMADIYHEKPETV